MQEKCVNLLKISAERSMPEVTGQNLYHGGHREGTEGRSESLLFFPVLAVTHGLDSITQVSYVEIDEQANSYSA
jgi:hypothetical protein